MQSGTTSRFGWAIALAVLLGLSGCGSADQLTVAAAASLRIAFPKLIDPDDIQLTFGASSALATQVGNAAPIDVIATANSETMAGLGALVENPVTFARNAIVIAVPRGNPAKVTGLADLAKPDLRVVLCADPVPCGSAAAKAFAKAGITVLPDSKEPDVAAVISKVVLGEADAAIVYRTDVLASAGRAEAIRLPANQQVPAVYQIAVVAASKNKQAAGEFIAKVTGAAGRKALEDAGFDVE